MKLFAPNLVGPLSICSTWAEVKGNIAGASIEIRVAGTLASSHVSKRPDGLYAIGVTLQANQIVTASQTINGHTSPESLPITVQAAPSQLSPLTVRTSLHTCGRAVRVTGATPGAKIDVQIGAQNAGSGNAARGWAGVEYDPGQAAGLPLTLNQITCNNLTASQSTVTPVELAMSLPAPVIQTPLFECQTRITIGGVVDGAYVELYRNNEPNPEDRFIFSISEEFRWIKPLVKNDVIRVRQGFSCKQPAPPLEITSSFATATVQPVSSLHAPKFVGILCPGSTFVMLKHLVPGARVILSQNGVELGETDAPGVTHTFAVPALKAGATVEAWMSLCNGESPKATIQVGAGAVTPGIGISPPYACASFVEVDVNAADGNFLAYITNKSGQQISPYENLIDFANNLIPVFPSLVAGDQITVHVLGCGGSWKDNGPTTVLAAPPQAIIVHPVYAGYKSCQVAAAAGFLLDLYVNDAWKGSAVSLGIDTRTTFTLPTAFHAGDQISCTMTVCGMVGKPTPPVTVALQPPDRPILLDPPNGADHVLLQPAFIWKDPGEGTPAAASSYLLHVTQSGNTIINQPVSATSYTSPVMLATDTDYQWNVESINGGGHENALAAFSFSTVLPPTSDLKFVPPITITVNSQPHGLPFPRGTPFDATIKIANQGNVASGPYQVVFKFVDADNLNHTAALPMTIAKSALASGGQDSATVPVTLVVNEPTVRINAFLMVNNQQVDQAFLDG